MGSRAHDAQGYTLIELIVATDTLYRDLVMAGAGPYQGATVGGLVSFFAPIVPRRVGRIRADVEQVYRDNAMTLVYVPHTVAQATISQPMAAGSEQFTVNDHPSCPTRVRLCGFSRGMEVLIFDDMGHYDVLKITGVQGEVGTLQNRGSTLSTSYGAGTTVTEARSHTYWFDRARNQLRHYDGYQSDVPIVDNVVGLKFTYFGDPNPPLVPRPSLGVENCVFDASGMPKLLDLGDGALVELPGSILSDGPFCGAAPNRYDADLLRIRRVGVDLRVQVAAGDLRGSDPALFIRPGTAAPGARWVPDYQVRFDVATTESQSGALTGRGMRSGARRDAQRVRPSRERGMALVVALMAMLLLTALGLALVLTTSTETVISANHRMAHETLHAADAGIERAMRDLMLVPRWDDVLTGSVASSFTDLTRMPTLPDGSTLDLASATAELQGEIDAANRWNANNPRWRLYAYGPLSDLTPTGSVRSRAYVAVWVADDPADGAPDATAGDGNPLFDTNGVLTLRAEAYGPMNSRRVVEATVARTGQASVRVLSWRELRR